MHFLVLGNEQDEHAAHILTELRTRGHACEFLDSTKYPSELRISFDPASRIGSIQSDTGWQLRLDEVDAVYWRSYAGTLSVELPNAEQSYIAQNDVRGLFESLLKHLPTHWVNGWEAFQLHQTKPAALAKVAALGVPVPATLLSNDAELIELFIREHDEVIFKPVQGGAHTELITSDHLSEAQIHSLRFAPVTLQQRICGTDIRVFLAGERVAACAIKTKAIDFRDDPYPEFESVELPTEVRDQCRRAAEALHLKWTGIDLRRTSDGGYFFLEANPSPMFLGFERHAGLPLTEMLVELLESGTGSKALQKGM